MAAANTAILHFLLPQLTWKGPVSALALGPSSSLLTVPKISLVLQHRHHLNRKFRPLSSSFIFPHTSKPRSSSTTSSLFTQPVPVLLNRRYKLSIKKNNGNVSTVASQKALFSTAPHWGRDHHFDTLKVVQRLKDEGFSEEQSRAMMLVLSDVIEESIQNLTRTMVLREGSAFYLLSPPPPFQEPISNAPFSKKKKQMPTAAPTRLKSTSPNSAPSSFRPTRTKRPSHSPRTNASATTSPNWPPASGTRWAAPKPASSWT